MNEFEAIKDRMAELKEERLRILSLTDITGGVKGMRINDHLYRRAEKIQRKIQRLNKKLANPFT